MQKKDGTMKKLINSKHLSTAIFMLSIIAIVKIIWIAISILFLPTTGEEYKEPNRVKKLYYRVRLTNESKIIVPPKPIVKKSIPKVSSMSGYKLLGLYNSKEKIVVTIEKNRKTTVLTKGEDINGFVLVSAGRDYAIFKKSGEEFKLSLTNSKKILNRVKYQHKRQHPALTISSSSIVDEGGVKRIPRTLLTSYTKNMDKIWRDIAIDRHQTNGKLDGYKIKFVKKGSDFEKLGLKRGDILVEINAEPLNSLSAAMNFFKEINNIENLTLTVIRDGKREDIEYEIQ